MKLSKKTLEIAFAALNERSRATADIARLGLTLAIREAAQKDYEETNKAWGEVEQTLLAIEESETKNK